MTALKAPVDEIEFPLIIDCSGTIIATISLQPEVLGMILKYKDKEMPDVSMEKAINNILFEFLSERLGKQYKIKTLDGF